MCGLVGLSLAAPRSAARPLVEAMSDTIAHRGPDSAGVYGAPSGRTWLGFRRLAIRDLAARADQPMLSASGRTAIAFNGEIYNSAALADRYCPDARLDTTGDTEALLESWERQGESILPDCNGMFGVALLDVASDTLSLVRDRMGKKPLYVHEGDGFVAFASELRALKGLGLDADPSRGRSYFFHFGYLPSPHTFFKNTWQLRPGEVVEIRYGRVVGRRRFFDMAELPWATESRLDADALDRELADAVSIRTLSDVPLGAFLSGGIDSSLIAAHLAASGHRDVPCFTVALQDASLNEAPFAKTVATRLGLPHETIRIDESALPDLVDDYLDCYEQPYADTSGLPTMLLCAAVRRHVTVALAGDGGDEFFGGYVRYRWFQKALLARRAPRVARSLAGALATRLDRRRGARIARLLAAGDPAELYATVVRAWGGGDLAELLPDMPDADAAPVALVRDLFGSLDADPLAKAACFDASYYIPDELQVKIDRASMRVALEVRCPLLDARVAARGARLVTRAKLDNGLKTPLRTQLARHLPRALFERRKQGFSVPVARWMAGPLRQSMEEALASRALRECGWIDMGAVGRLHTAFSAGRRELALSLWMLFIVARQLEAHTSVVRFPEAADFPLRKVA